ncbi:MAG TPA: UDP-N-acetylmuramoyl-L-alanine--D-glutamate ligase [Patescibacteria group bacterium]|nr:UDP-N-acetylmuramoyl-L-alanine--D-glutamate ligase [Patescibacteria group bacterium]
MKIAILGYARDGQAAYEHWNHQGSEITICDQNDKIVIPVGALSQLGPDYLKNLDQFDVLVRSSGLAPRLIAEANPDSPDILAKVTGNIDEFFRVSPSKNIIGVTGTKGKGTTSTLIAKMLEAAGLKVHLGGNIGIPALELLKNNIQPDDWVVLEQSSFQLIDQKHSPHIAVCLMVVSEHMDWHVDMEEYVRAKQQLFINQSASDMAIYYAQNDYSKQIADVSPGTKIPFFAIPGAIVLNGDISIGGQSICRTEELKLLGKHNWQNVCAALTAAWQITKDVNAIKSVLTSFTGLEHRLELVRDLAGIKYYDDSFGTTPETAMVAIEAFEQPKVVILGGSDKGASFDQLAATVKNNNVRKVVLIGNTASKIHSALEGAGFNDVIEGGENIHDIVATARSQAKAGDVVLLSTGCASFGLFKDYMDRGEQFKSAVLALV